MKITLEATGTIDTISRAVPARIWKGHTESGVPLMAWITLISPQTRDPDAHAEFERELKEVPALRELTSFDVRLL